MRILVVGGGWYGCHIAAEIKRQAPNSQVSIFEKCEDIFTQISGKYGIRLHAGPHYPRSPATREACQRGFNEFLKHYPQLVNHHTYSDYGYGILDTMSQPSKVTKTEFMAVCQELKGVREVDPKERNYESLGYVADIVEPSIIVGHRLRVFFWNYLQELGIRVCCNFEVESVEKYNGTSIVRVKDEENQYEFDHVINTTSFQSLVPVAYCFRNPLPQKLNVIYQTCISLVYEQQSLPVPEKPFSFIVLDGWFPCLMPYDDRKSSSETLKKYMFIHGKWTILGSFATVSEAKDLLAKIDDDFICKFIKRNCESDMNRFWPKFSENFKFIGWDGTVLAKVKTDTEFRSAVTFQSTSNGVIHVFPGKVNNIFDAGREVLSFIGLRQEKFIFEEQGFVYVQGGSLDVGKCEIKSIPRLHNTCDLQTYNELLE